ncbi:Uncharacterised protein [Vibrio cholerae]|nr:Uncharacterised protein [Vibrio cholerae]
MNNLINMIQSFLSQHTTDGKLAVVTATYPSASRKSSDPTFLFQRFQQAAFTLIAN